VEDRKYNGETALLIAAQQENGAAVIQELVAAGANIHTLNDLGSNAIMLAAWQHHLENVKLLIQLGVDPCVKNQAGESAVDEAESNLNDDPGKREIITFLQAKCNR
jgi:ankyrin repeat protein